MVSSLETGRFSFSGSLWHRVGGGEWKGVLFLLSVWFLTPPSAPQECPSGIVNEENFKQIYSQFFPQGGEGTRPERKQLSISRLSWGEGSGGAGNAK